MKNQISEILFGLSLCAAFIFYPVFSHAQFNPYSVEELSDLGTTKDFVVGPGKVELEVTPGELTTYNLKVTNRIGEAKTFKVEIEDFTGSNNPEQTVILLGDERGPYSLKDYISVPAYEFTLQNGERATVPVTVSIPLDAESGGRYGSVIFSILSDDGNAEKGHASSPIISRIGVLFFVTVPGEIKKEGSLDTFQAKAGKKLFSDGQVSFEILFRNTGTVHLNPYGEIRVKNILGKEVGNTYVDPWFAMPNSLRYREMSWDRPFLFGMYKAEAAINRGYGENGGIIDTANFTFFVLPLKLVLIIFGSIIGLILVIKLILKFFLSKFEFKRKI